MIGKKLICVLCFLFLHGIVLNVIAQAPPVAVEDEIYTIDNVSVNGSLADNDLNPDGSVLTYTLLVDTDYGNLIVNPDGSWTFDPNPEAAAINQVLSYQVCDQIGQCSIGSIGLFIQFHNDPPQANDDNILVEMDAPRSGNLSDNDFDPDYLSDPLSTQNSFQNISNPANGTVVVYFDGSFTYTPNPGFTGSDSFLYINCDACSVCDVATAFLTVVASNEDPQASDAFFTLNEDESLTADLSSYASDPENDPLDFALISLPLHGIISLMPDGEFLYTPDAEYSGSDTFIYSVCDELGQCDISLVTLVIELVNDPPMVSNESIFVFEDSGESNGDASDIDSDDNGPLTYSLLTGPEHGIASVTPGGNFTYAPLPDYSGSDLFVLSVCDPLLLCASDTVFVQVIAVNDAPSAEFQETYGYEDDPVTGSLFATDSDNDPLAFTVVSSDPGGQFDLNSDGSYVFTPDANFSGFVSIDFQVCDPFDACVQASFLIEIIEINDDPIIVADSYTENEDTQVTGNLRDNDIEPDGEEIFYFNTTNASHGVFVLESDGHFTYTPDQDWYGTETISFYGCDPCSVCGLSSLTITILPVNDPPSALSGSGILDEDALFNGDLSSLVSDADDNAWNFSITNSALSGVIDLQSDGSFSYQPTSNFNGADVFTFEACDLSGACVLQNFDLQILPVNDSPVSFDEFFFTNEDEVLSDNLTSAFDIDGDALTYILLTAPQHGTINLSDDGSFIYTPEANYYGDDSFVCSICDPLSVCVNESVFITVAPVQDIPLAVDDFNVTYQNEFLLGDASINDIDPDGDLLNFALLTSTINGDLIFAENGSFEYYPYLDFSGSDSFTYQVCDSFGNCDTATYDLTIFTTNTAPVAADDAFTSPEDAGYSSSLLPLINDLEGGVFTFSLLTTSTSGSLNLQNNGSYTYLPQLNYSGPDNFTYRVCDSGNRCDTADVFITVTPVNDSPVATDDSFDGSEDILIEGLLSSNDSDIENDLLSYELVSPPAVGDLIINTDGSFSFQPSLNFNGNLEFTYEVCDAGGLCDQAVCSMVITPENDLPFAEGESYQMNEDTELGGELSLNDSDVDDDPLTYSLISNATSGVLTLFPDGSFYYQPFSNFYGDDSFTYQVCDNGGLCASATASILVNAVNDMPAVADDNFTIQEEELLSGSLSDNDSDLETLSLVYTALSAADNGLLQLESDGSFTYTPLADFYGVELIDIQVCDDADACVVQELMIEVDAVNDAPQANNDVYEVDEDASVDGNLLNNDSDVDDLVLFVTLITQPVYGILEVSENGQFTYMPFSNANGQEEVTYQTCDAGGLCDEATLSILIHPLNDAPVIAGEYVHVMEETIGSGDVSENDVDADNDPLTYTLLTSPVHGGFTLSEDGTYSYEPVINFWGLDSAVYLVCDPSGLCDSATLVLEVDFVNDAPIVYDESVQVVMNQAVEGDVSLNDIELDDEVLVYFVLEDNSAGQFTMYEDGSYIYTPGTDVTGVFEVIYYACDPCSVCDQGVLTFYVLPQKELNTPPTALDASEQSCAGHAIEFDMAALISDTQNQDFELLVEFSDPEIGTIDYDSETQVLTFNSGDSDFGSISIEYIVCDAGLLTMCDTAHITVDLTETVHPMVNEWYIQDVACFGESTGSIGITMASGGNDFNYAWSNDSIGPWITGLTPGFYTLTLTSDLACSVPETFTYQVEGPSSALSASLAMAVNISDNFDGAIFIDIAGGTPPYDVEWTGPLGFTSDQEDISELIQEGSYSALITDANGCTTDLGMNITGLSGNDFPAQVSIAPNPCDESFVLTFDATSAHRVTIDVMDATGRKVYSHSPGVLVSGKWTIDSSELASGYYALRLDLDGISKTFPLIRK